MKIVLVHVPFLTQIRQTLRGHEKLRDAERGSLRSPRCHGDRCLSLVENSNGVSLGCWCFFFLKWWSVRLIIPKMAISQVRDILIQPFFLCWTIVWCVFLLVERDGLKMMDTCWNDHQTVEVPWIAFRDHHSHHHLACFFWPNHLAASGHGMNAAARPCLAPFHTLGWWFKVGWLSMFSATRGGARTPHCHPLQTWLTVVVVVVDGDGDGDGDCRSDLEFQSGSIHRLSVG